VKFCQIGSGRQARGDHGRGLPTLLEKPPGLDVAEIDRLSAAATRTGAPHLVAFNRRFVPLVRELARRLAALGGPEAVHHLRYEMARHAPSRLEHLASGSLAEDLPGGDAAEFERGVLWRVSGLLRDHRSGACPRAGPRRVAPVGRDCRGPEGAQERLPGPTVGAAQAWAAASAEAALASAPVTRGATAARSMGRKASR
jgi:hypothetical protein